MSSTHSEEDVVGVIVGEGEEEEGEEGGEAAVEDGRPHLRQGGRGALLPAGQRVGMCTWLIFNKRHCKNSTSLASHKNHDFHLVCQ